MQADVWRRGPSFFGNRFLPLAVQIHTQSTEGGGKEKRWYCSRTDRLRPWGVWDWLVWFP